MTQRQQKAKVGHSAASEGPKNPKTSQILANTLIKKLSNYESITYNEVARVS